MQVRLGNAHFFTSHGSRFGVEVKAVVTLHDVALRIDG